MNIDNKIQKDVVLAPLTTFKIGGPAKFFIEVKTKEEFTLALDWAEENKEDVFVLAGGSNVLINDNGIDGLVIKMSNSDIKIKGERLECGAGASLSAAVLLATKENLTGMEWAVGIPGTIGGAIRGNAGGYDSNIGETIETVEVLDARKNQFLQFSRRDCEFNYRTSIFKTNSDLLIWQTILRLKKGRTDDIKKEINNYVKNRAKTNPKLPSAGSVFKNIDFKTLDENNIPLAEKAKEEGIVKNDMVGAGWLIDMLDLKGKTIGGAKVSLEHANFIVNTGKATAEDVVALISYIKQQVRDRFKIQLQEEVQYLGF